MTESCIVDLLEFEVIVTSPKSGGCYAKRFFGNHLVDCRNIVQR